jgi:hypothetical protein
VKRRSLLAAVRDRMHVQRSARVQDTATATPAPSEAAPAPAPAPAEPAALPAEDLEQLEAEARYHRERYELYHARVVSGSNRATSPTRLRELEHTATAAEERLANARRHA